MVAIDRQHIERREWSILAILGLFLRDFLYPFAIIFRVIGNRRAAAGQRRRAAIAERISVAAAGSSGSPVAEPARLSASEMTARLHDMTTLAVTVAGDVVATNTSAESNLDWVSYELEAIRRDIAGYMPA